jgi:alkylation response protein AidB-like acyl-CoA dehydrogenase
MHNLADRLAALVAPFRARQAEYDSGATFPAGNITDLHAAGALTAPFPISAGGLGWGTDPAGAIPLLTALRRIGQGSLATGRLWEGHVNAIRLVATYGTPAQLRALAQDAAAGHLLGLWVTDGATPLRLDGRDLTGAKSICSGAGHLTCALVTAQPPAGDAVLAIVHLDNRARATPSAIRLQGMRAATTGAMDLTGLEATVVGQPGDYLRQPDFSAGAWRTSAVTLGGMDALIALTQAELTARGRAENPHQLARMGAALIAQETAALWLTRAATLAEAPTTNPGHVAAYVNLARIAVEAAALDLIRLVQRSLGLSAFIQGHPAEILLRDLATYLRQPAPDETLTEAAAWFSNNTVPA